MINAYLATSQFDKYSKLSIYVGLGFSVTLASDKVSIDNHHKKRTGIVRCHVGW